MADALRADCDVKSDNLSVNFPMAVSITEIQELIGRLHAESIRPRPNGEAMSHLKFSECLSASLSAEVFTTRFDDRTGINQALKEPRRLVRNEA
jgi:hypothetical protein